MSDIVSPESSPQENTEKNNLKVLRMADLKRYFPENRSRFMPPIPANLLSIGTVIEEIENFGALTYLLAQYVLNKLPYDKDHKSTLNPMLYPDINRNFFEKYLDSLLEIDLRKRKFYGKTSNNRVIIVPTRKSYIRRKGELDIDDNAITFLAIRDIVSTGLGKVGDFSSQVTVYALNEEKDRRLLGGEHARVDFQISSVGSSQKITKNLIEESRERWTEVLSQGLKRVYRGGSVSPR